MCIRDSVKAAQEKVATSTAETAAANVSVLQKLREPNGIRNVLSGNWNELDYSKRSALVKLPTFDFLAKWANDQGIPRLLETNTLLQQMNGSSQKFLENAESMISMVRRAFAKDPALRKKISDFVYTTTLARIDPSDPNAKERSKELDLSLIHISEPTRPY